MKECLFPHERGWFNFTRLQTEALGEPPPTHIGTMVKISQYSFKLFQEM